MSDCRTCIHNTFIDNKDVDWVCCTNPTTIAKMPRWQQGDPAWVNMQTGDIPVSRISELADCLTYEGPLP